MTLVLDPPATALLAPVDVTTRREMLTASVLLGLGFGLAGCSAEPNGPQPPSATRQRFRDSVGRDVDIPTRPQRIVTLHEATSGAALLSVGAPVVGMVKDDSLPYRPYDTSGITGVGSFAEPDLESIAALRPDLIVAYGAGGRTYPDNLPIETLQRIAPTVAFAEDLPLEEYMQAVAAISGRPEEVAEQRAAYLAELADLRAAVPQAAELSVAVAGATDTEIYVFAADNPTPSVAIPQEIGARPAAVAQRPSEDGLYVTFSAERLADIRADVILYDSFGEQITESALWERLPAVRAGQAHLMPTVFGASYANYRYMMTPLREILADAMALTPDRAGAR